VSPIDRSREAEQLTLSQVLGNWVVFLAAAGILAVGIWLLVDILSGAPVAADFTRVGGATGVETAVDASRFWLSAPASVVETPAGAPPQVMLGAAACAMARDAPLLFTPSNPSRKMLVHIAVSAFPQSPRQEDPKPIAIQTASQAARCLPKTGHFIKVNGLSILNVPSQRHLLPWVPTQQMLGPFVVFAAAIGPRRLPDVAVGLALAAHLAEAQGEPVSLVYVQPYVEADPELEDQLRNQPAVVQGGIVLGQTPTVPEDTRELLRQLITSVNQQNLLEQIQANLGSVAPLVAALLALFGITAATRKAPAIAPQVAGTGRWVGSHSGPMIKRTRQKAMELMRRVANRVPSPKGANMSTVHLLAGLKPDEVVTVWLSSGWKVTGTFVKQEKARGALHLRDATLEHSEEPTGEYANTYVPVEDIQLVGVNPPKADQSKDTG
jgi:hypothetical protein